MFKKLMQNPRFTLGAGLAMGLLIGLGMMIGAVTATSWLQQPRMVFPETALHASATHGGETFAMATGLIDDDIEGVFFLDYLTGDLDCRVLNTRTGNLGGVFKQNILNDLGGASQGKKARYLLTTGVANFRGSSGNVRPAKCIVYVANADTGAFAAYSLPWSRGRAAAGGGQLSPMVLIGKGKVRNIQIRE